MFLLDYLSRRLLVRTTIINMIRRAEQNDMDAVLGLVRAFAISFDVDEKLFRVSFGGLRRFRHVLGC